MSGFSFGTTPASTAPGTTTGFSFGNTAPAPAPAPSAFSFGTAPATGNLFGTPASSSGLTLGTGTATGGFGQGLPTGSVLGAPAASTAPALNLSTSTPFGAPATTSTAPAAFNYCYGTNPPPSSAGSTGFSFGIAKPATSLPGSVAPTTTVGSFGVTSTAGPGLFGQTQPNIGGGTCIASATQGTMTFEELEKKCNEWKKELEFQEESFLKRATQINAWDRLITANAEKITELHEYMKKVKSDQERMDRELDFVVAQQKELEEMLAPLEQEALALESTSIQHHTDFERQTTYNSATTVNAQLRGMAERIKDIIEHINANNKSANDASSISQITKILNAHVDVLQFIQNGIDSLQQKTEDINKLLATTRM